MNRLARGVAGLALCLGGCVVTTDEERLRDYVTDGMFLFQRGQYVDARESFQAALAREPNDPALLYNLGECYEHLGNVPKAECLYRECLNRSPKHAACRHAMVELLARAGRQNEAELFIATWLKDDPSSPDPYAEQGWLLHHAGDLPSAQLALQHALQLDPHHRLAMTELALVYEALGRPDRSLVLYERILEADPNQPDVTNRVNMLLAKGTRRRIRIDVPAQHAWTKKHAFVQLPFPT